MTPQPGAPPFLSSHAPGDGRCAALSRSSVSIKAMARSAISADVRLRRRRRGTTNQLERAGDLFDLQEFAQASGELARGGFYTHQPTQPLDTNRPRPRERERARTRQCANGFILFTFRIPNGRAQVLDAATRDPTLTTRRSGLSGLFRNSASAALAAASLRRRASAMTARAPLASARSVRVRPASHQLREFFVGQCRLRLSGRGHQTPPADRRQSLSPPTRGTSASVISTMAGALRCRPKLSV